jgi:hypothetical protein
MEESNNNKDEALLDQNKTLTNKQLKKRAKKKAKRMAAKQAANNENNQTDSKQENQNEETQSNENHENDNDNEEIVTSTETVECNLAPISNETHIQSQQQQEPEGSFDNLTKAVHILGKAKQLDESKQFEPALKLYRQGVDMLLEELIERQGTDQSRNYLRDKCNNFM